MQHQIQNKKYSREAWKITTKNVIQNRKNNLFSITTIMCWKKYKRNVKYIKIKNKSVYSLIMDEFIEFCKNEILDGDIIKLFRLGKFYIRGNKINMNDYNKLPVDWKQTKLLWERCEECKESKQLVRHLNEHSDFLRFKVIWDRRFNYCTNKNVYVFLPAEKSFLRKIAKRINEGGHDHYIIK